VVADKFDKKHVYVVRVIQTLINNFSGDFKSPEILEKSKGDANFKLALPLKKHILNNNLEIPLFFKKEGKSRGKKFIYYEMDKEFFSHLTMRFRGEKAFIWQCKFIKAFFQMEEALLRQSNLEWQREREQGKQIRLALTDEIKIFIDYAFTGGSQNANNYYSTITKMQYKALGLIEKNEKIDKEFRNTLDMMDLNNLISSEQIARKALMDGIEQKLHYKDIFQLAKKRVLQFANIIIIRTTKKEITLD